METLYSSVSVNVKEATGKLFKPLFISKDWATAKNMFLKHNVAFLHSSDFLFIGQPTPQNQFEYLW